MKSTLLQRTSEHLPTDVGYNAKLQSGQDPGEDDEHADELFEHKFFSCAHPQFYQLSGWLVSDKKPDVEVLGWRGSTWSAVVLPNSLKWH